MRVNSAIRWGLSKVNTLWCGGRDIGSLAGRQLGEQIHCLTSFSPSCILLGLIIAFRRSGSRRHKRTIHMNQEQRAGGRVRGGVEDTSAYGFSYDLLFQSTLSFWDSSVLMCLIVVHSVLLLFFIFHCVNWLQFICHFLDDGYLPVFILMLLWTFSSVFFDVYVQKSLQRVCLQ